MTKQRREGQANGPQGQRPARVSRGGPSWTEFVRLADQAVVAIAGAGMINRAEPRACGYSRDPRRLDTEPETERNAGPASNEAGDGFGRVQDAQAGFQPYWGKPAVRNEPRGWRNRRHDLMAICHDARKGRHSGSHWSKPARLRSTRPAIPIRPHAPEGAPQGMKMPPLISNDLRLFSGQLIRKAECRFQPFPALRATAISRALRRSSLPVPK